MDQLPRSTPIAATTWERRPNQTNLAGAEVIGAVHLAEALWAPERIVPEHAAESGAWLDVAKAIVTRDQDRLNRGLAAARNSYPAAGYGLLFRGYAYAAWIAELVLVVD